MSHIDGSSDVCCCCCCCKRLSSHAQNVSAMVEVLRVMQSWIDEVPPLPHRSRFGNEAFVTWFDKAAERLPALLQRVLFPPPHDARSVTDGEKQRHGEMIGAFLPLLHRLLFLLVRLNPVCCCTDELAAYLINSVGDRSRIDYGTGHEAHFVVWMYVMASSEM